MYTLFLCLRYLLRKAMAYFAMVSVALCVALMLIVVSVMDGFLHKIETAAKGLFGDIVVESSSMTGMPGYDEFIRDHLRKDVEEVEAASPFILAYGIVRIPEHGYQQTVQIAGIRLPERAKVTSFADGLFAQAGRANPSFDPPKDVVLNRLEAESRGLIRQALADGTFVSPSVLQDELLRDQPWAKEALAQGRAWPEDPTELAEAGRISSAWSFQETARRNIENAEETEERIAALEKAVEAAREEGDDERVSQLRAGLKRLYGRRFLPPGKRVILGLGIPGLSHRTADGRTIRFQAPGNQVVLVLAPVGSTTVTDATPTYASFTVIDDCLTGVSSIDQNIVYAPFETLQELVKLNELRYADGTVDPPRCSAIHLKIRNAERGEKYLMAVREKVQRSWDRFQLVYRKEHPGYQSGMGVTVQTWRQRQHSIISSIAAQRVLVIIMFALISMVAVVLIFVIFYTVVVQKTRDIGVIKSVGGSNAGVAAIFLAYGACIGLVGSVLGTIGGYFFVRNINPIHDWVGRTFGLVVWSREYFMFDHIPNEVQPLPGAIIVVCAVAAGVVGALLPALKAARMQPVEALRYE